MIRRRIDKIRSRFIAYHNNVLVAKQVL
jgi:hypothetical protein